MSCSDSNNNNNNDTVHSLTHTHTQMKASIYHPLCLMAMHRAGQRRRQRRRKQFLICKRLTQRSRHLLQRQRNAQRRRARRRRKEKRERGRERAEQETRGISKFLDLRFVCRAGRQPQGAGDSRQGARAIEREGCQSIYNFTVKQIALELIARVALISSCLSNCSFQLSRRSSPRLRSSPAGREQQSCSEPSLRATHVCVCVYALCVRKVRNFRRTAAAQMPEMPIRRVRAREHAATLPMATRSSAAPSMRGSAK